MMTRIEVDKTNYPCPGEIGATLQELMNWRDNRAKKDLPCGALDHAINHLRSFQALTQKIYEAELKTPDLATQQLGLEPVPALLRRQAE